MRNTRTAAACLAATTLLGMLSATPAMAEQLDGGAGGIVQRDASAGPGLGLLGRSAADVPAGQSDRGEVAITAGQQPGGSDGLPLLRTPREVPSTPAPTPPATEPALAGAPTEPTAAPAPAAPASATSPAPAGNPAPSQGAPVVSVTYADRAYIDMPEVFYTGGETRVKVFVNGVVAAELWDGSNSGSVSNSVHVGDRFLFAVDAAPGDQVKVVASDVDGSGVTREGSERVLFDKKM